MPRYIAASPEQLFDRVATDLAIFISAPEGFREEFLKGVTACIPDPETYSEQIIHTLYVETMGAFEKAHQDFKALGQ